MVGCPVPAGRLQHLLDKSPRVGDVHAAGPGANGAERIRCRTHRGPQRILGLAEIEVLGLCSVAGNVPLALTTENALKICELAGRTDVQPEDIPLSRGARRQKIGF